MASDLIDDEDADGRQTVEDGVYAVKVGTVRYAVGLLWNDVNEPSQAAAEARKTAALPGIDADLFCVRSRSEQYGLGKRADGQAKQMPSLAGHLADSKSGSWLGVFPLEGGFYCIAVQDDMVVEDLFLRDEVDARAKLDDRISSSDWGETFAPDAFGIDASKEVSVETLLNGKPPRLQGIDRVGSAVKYAAFALLVLAVLGGGAYWLKMQDEAEMAAQLAEMQRKALELAPGQKQQVKPPPAPWENMYKAASYVEACRDAMAMAKIDIPGWRSTGLVCDGHTQVAMTIERMAKLGSGGGTINWVRWALDRGGMKDAVASSGTEADKVLVTWNFPTTPEKWRPADVDPTPKGPGVNAIHRYLQSQFEETFTSPTFQPPASVALNGTDFYRTQKFKFVTQYEPSSFSRILDRVNGLVVSKITLDLKNLTYDVEGQANEQLPLPAPPVRPAPGAPSPVASR